MKQEHVIHLPDKAKYKSQIDYLLNSYIIYLNVLLQTIT